MSGYATTPNFALKKPITGADDDQWGTHWNQNADTLDSTLQSHALSLAGGPVRVADYPSIQAALDALPANGGTVMLALGVAYTLTAGLTCAKPNVTLTASGWGSIIRRDSSLTTGVLVNLTGAGSIIENLTIDGNNVVPTNYSGFAEVSVGGANSVVRNCQIINGRGTISLTLGGTNSKALFNTITAPGVNLGLETGYGIWAITGVTVLIEGNTITGTGIDGIGFDGEGSRVVNNRLSGCHWYTGRSGGNIVYYSTNGTRMAMIANNYIGPGGPNADGIEISGQNCVVLGNTVDSVGGLGIHLAPNTGNVVIANGIIRNTGSTAPGVLDGIYVEANVSDFSITGMRITDTQATPTMRDAVHINAGTSNNYVITGNILAPTASRAIQDLSSGVNKVARNNKGIEDVYRTVATSGTISLVEQNPVIMMSGSGTVTAVNALAGQNRPMSILIGAGATVTFASGASIANTVTCMANSFHSAMLTDGKLYIGT